MKKILLLLAVLAALSPAGESSALEERTTPCVVAEGQSLIRILRARGVAEREMPKYFTAIKELNPEIRNIDRIRPGRAVTLPTAAYFRVAAAASPARNGSAPPPEGAAAQAQAGNAPAPSPDSAPPATAAPPAGAASPAPAADNASPAPAASTPGNGATPAAAAPAETPATSPAMKSAAATARKIARSTTYLSMDFTDVDLPVLIKFMSEQTKRNFIFDERVAGKITIISPRKVTLDEAYDVFISVLQVKGYTTIEQGNAIKIVPLSAAKQENLPNAKDPDGTSVSEFVTRLIPLQFVESPEIVQLMTPLMSKDGLITSFPASNTLILIDSRANVDRLVRILSEIDTEGAPGVMRIVPLKNASCVEIGKTIESIFQESPSAAAPGQPAGRSRRPRAPGGGRGVALKVIPDPRTNSLILLAGKEQMAEIEDLVSKLDIPAPANTGKINVYYLENADAEEMSKVLANLAEKRAGGAPSAPGAAPGAAATVKGVIAAELEGGVKITADKATNSLIIIASVNDYQVLVDVIKKLDIRRRQVYVEALIMEISLDKSRDVGVEFRGAVQTGSSSGAVLTGTNFGFDGGVNSLLTAIASGNPLAMTGTGMIAGGIGGNVTLPDGSKIPAITAILRAAQEHQNVNILSSPHLLTLDNKDAEIIVGENVPFITSNLTNTTNTSSVTNTIERKDVGITLKITPHIHESEFVSLDIYQESSSVKGGASQLLNVNQVGPTTLKRSAKTSVLVRSGDTVVLGGMMQETISTTRKQVPLLGDIPLIGYLFKYNAASRQKTNMVIFLTPKIIKNPQDMVTFAEEKQKAMDKFIEMNKGEVERIIPDQKPSAAGK
jgi:general secretion pathway protein D